MTNTEKERLALLVGDKSITCAKLQQAFPEIYDAYLQLLSSNMTQDHCLLVPGHPLPPNREYFLHYQPDATFHLSEQGQDALDAALEKEALLRYEQEMRDIAHNQLLIGGMTLFISALALIASIIMFIAS